MQWLIDIIIELMWESIYSRGIYRDRGFFSGADFTQINLTTDNLWHELDLSGIIEENAKAVCIRIKARTTAIPKQLNMRKKGVTTITHTCEFRTQVANLDNNAHFVVGVDADRKCEYKLSDFAWTDISMVIRGWFM